MADEGRVCVQNKQTVLRIHEKLQKEIHKIAEKKSWTAEQRDEFEKNLLELYKESVEETIKANVAIGGQEWDNVTQAEATSSSVCLTQEEIEPLNRDRVAQVFALCSELEDLLKDTTSKRKKYPHQITEEIKKILQSRKEMLEKYQSIVKSDSSLSSLNLSTPDFEECIQRLQTASHEITQLAKSFPELHSKVDRLRQVVQSHKSMLKSETDAVLFGSDSNSNNMHAFPVEALVSQDNQPSESLNSMDVMWWGGSKRKSQPPQRFDASKDFDSS